MTEYFSPEDFDEETIEAFNQGWLSDKSDIPGARRRAGLAAALNYMLEKEVEGHVQALRRDSEQRP